MRPIPDDPALPNLHELFPSEGTPDVVADLAREVTGTHRTTPHAQPVHVRYRRAEAAESCGHFRRRPGTPP